MPDEELTASEDSDAAPILFDYIYKDAERIASLYAQLYKGGVLKSTEKNTLSKRASDNIGRLGIQGTGLESKLASETQESLKEVFDPHDTITSDVLQYLTANNRIDFSDVLSAKPNTVVYLRGDLLFVDPALVTAVLKVLLRKAGEGALEPFPAAQAGKLDVSEQDMGEFLDVIKLPTTFYLSGNVASAAGTIKESGLSEPVFSYYIRSGQGGIQDVHIIGIVEEPGYTPEWPDLPILAGIQRMAKVLHELYFPDYAVRVSPLAIYREIAPVEEEEKP